MMRKILTQFDSRDGAQNARALFGVQEKAKQLSGLWILLYVLHKIKTERKNFQATILVAKKILYQNDENFIDINAIKNSKVTKRISKFKTQNIGLEKMGGCISKKKGE